MNRFVIALLTLVLCACDAPARSGGTHQGDAEPHQEEHGPHGGRLLQSGDFALEVTIFEDGVPPEFRAYPYWRGRPVAPEEVSLSIALERLGGEVTRYAFAPRRDYLIGNRRVAEPHSFDVEVQAGYAGRKHRWEYASYEGRTTIDQAAAAAAGIEVAQAGPAHIHETLGLTGVLRVIPERVSHQRARFPGVIRSVKVGLNQNVKAGDVLATIQSNESLQTYSLKAPMDGVVLELDATAGEATGGDVLFVIADLSRLWAELDVFARDLARVERGQPVRVESLDGGRVAEGRIEMLSPVVSPTAQSVRARVSLDNEQGRWRPGEFVRGSVTVARAEVPLAVARDAVQRFRDFDVVFARVGETYEVRMLELGRRDPEHVEVLNGLSSGESYVATNSYLIKADVEKSGATHDH